MIERDDTAVRVTHPSLDWEAVHSGSGFGGPDRIALAGDELVRFCHNHIDDLDDRSIVTTQRKAFRRGGAAVVETRGYFPFGGEVKMAQTCRYAACHMRVTLDVNWPRGGVVRRHFGV